MKWYLDPGFVLPLFSALFMVGVTAWIIHDTGQPRPVGPERTYDTPFGSVACASEGWSNCGRSLWHCHDGATYTCLQNVRKRDQ